MNWKTWMCLPVLALVGCGGGGSGGGGTTPELSSAPQEEQAVVEMDVNGDEQPDIVTLDTSEMPYRIVEVIQGASGGAPIDATDLYAGTRIDGQVSRAIADYLAGSFGVESRTELDCENEKGDPITVVVME